jgi:thioesterase domain-containing protein
MTDGVVALSRMVGDNKFRRQKRINPEAADRWRAHLSDDTLGDATRRTAARLGYDAPAPSDPAGKTLAVLQPKGRKPPLFLVHGVGGEIVNFHSLVRHLGEDLPVYGLQAPLEDEDTDADALVEETAATYLHAIRGVQPRGPYRLAGYSFGATVAYEMARRLRADGEAVSFLGCIDQAPRNPPPRCAAETVAAATNMLINVPHWIAQLPRRHANDVLRSWTTRAGRLAARLWYRLLGRRDALARLHDGVPFFARHWPARQQRAAMRRHRAMGRYRYRPYDGSLVFFRARCQKLLALYDRAKGWERLAASVTVHVVPGDHEAMLAEPAVGVLAEKLRETLTKEETDDRTP